MRAMTRESARARRVFQALILVVAMALLVSAIVGADRVWSFAWIEDVAAAHVAAAERGKGVGGRVLKEIAALLQARGIVAVHLEVDGQNERARAAYARAGFSSREKYHVMSLVL